MEELYPDGNKKTSSVQGAGKIFIQDFNPFRMNKDANIDKKVHFSCSNLPKYWNPTSNCLIDNTRKLHQDYGNWLNGYNWQYFGTFTTGYEMTIRTARRSMEGLFRELLKAGKTNMFWVAESFELKDGYHTHALLSVPEVLQYKNIIDIWQKVSGGSSRGVWNRIDLQKYNKARGAGYYVSKYVTKRLTDYDFLITG